jgi:hypothetical protein
MMVKGLVAMNLGKAFEGRFFTQALQIAGAAGFVTMEKQFTEMAVLSAAQAGRKTEQAIFERDLKSLLQRGPGDLHLVARSATSFLPVALSI